MKIDGQRSFRMGRSFLLRNFEQISRLLDVTAGETAKATFMFHNPCVQPYCLNQRENDNVYMRELRDCEQILPMALFF